MHGALAIGLIRFLKAERERESFKVLSRHAGVVLDTVKKFEEAAVAFSKHDSAKVGRLAKEIDGLETKADLDRRKFRDLLYEGAFLPVFRSDLDRLIERIDEVADVSKKAALLMVTREKLFKDLARAEKRRPETKSICKAFIQMADRATKATEALKGSVDALMSNVDEAVEKTKAIEQFEHEADVHWQELQSELSAYEKLFDPLTIIQIHEIGRLIEGISDRAEDAGDILAGLALEFRA